MKTSFPLALAAALAAAYLVANAQTPQPDNAPPASQTQAKASEPAAPPERSHSEPDPRHCLELQDNMQIHMCAEKYRPRRRAQ